MMLRHKLENKLLLNARFNNLISVSFLQKLENHQDFTYSIFWHYLCLCLCSFIESFIFSLNIFLFFEVNSK